MCHRKPKWQIIQQVIVIYETRQDLQTSVAYQMLMDYTNFADTTSTLLIMVVLCCFGYLHILTHI